MALNGNVAGKLLRGRINSIDTLILSAYAIAVKNGFEGTEEEWLASLKGATGKSPTVVIEETASGVMVEVTNADGTNYIGYVLHGEKGAAGADGKDGKTPVKGVDYFTEADKAEMVSAVISALPVYNGEVV